MMKFTLGLFLLLPFTSLKAQDDGNSAEIAAKRQSKYPYASATVQYKVTGDATGSSALYFDRNGWRSLFVKEIKLTRFGIESTERTIRLIDGDYVYHVNPDSRKGKKEINSNWSSLIPYKKNEEIVSAIMQQDGATLLRKDTLRNLTCRVWTFTSGTTSTLWEHQGIPLKIVKSLPGYEYSLEAVSIDQNSELVADTFTLPENIEWD